MAVTEATAAGSVPEIGRGGRLFVVLAAAIVAVVALVAGAGLVRGVAASKAEAEARHAARIDPLAVEPGRTAAEMGPPADARPSEVKIGVYVDRVPEVSIAASRWDADFYVWFRWTDEGLKPGETFQIVDGEITSKQKVTEAVHGDERYELYRVGARITKFFDVTRFPLDDHLMTINVEDGANQWDRAVYVVDEGTSSTSSRVQIPGYTIDRTAAAVKPHAYRTTRGDPTLEAGHQAIYSQFIYGLWIKRPDLGLFVKMYQGLFCAIAIAMLAFFVKPTDLDTRLALGVGAFFAAIANAYLTAGLVPNTGTATLADTVNAVGVAVIFLTLVQSTVSLHINDRVGNAALARVFDRVSFVVVLVVYVGLTVALIRATL